MTNKVYVLHYNKKKAIIKVHSSAAFQKQYNFVVNKSASDSDIVYLNNEIYLSLSRKALLQKAREIKSQWIAELEQHLKSINDIIIK